jgi:hypothetical protein
LCSVEGKERQVAKCGFKGREEDRTVYVYATMNTPLCHRTQNTVPGEVNRLSTDALKSVAFYDSYFILNNA